MATMRLDKLLSSMGYGSRKDSKAILKKGFVKVDGTVVKVPETKIDTDKNEVSIKGERLGYVKYVYIMMNKPQGVISATGDPKGEEKTVVELLDEKYQWFDIFPVGRLDKDAEGLLILTNDGKFAHRTLSPKKHVKKIYFVRVQGALVGQDVLDFKKGITIDDGYVCKEAVLRVLLSGEISEAEVSITEGKFHQVKKMFEALDKKVMFLKRIEFAGITLDESLGTGEYRELNDAEMEIIENFTDD